MTTVVYTASDGTAYDLTASMSMRLKTAKFHAFAWAAEVTTKKYGERVDSWKKNAQSYSAQILFKGTKAARKTALNAFHASIERDMIYNSPGTLAWGDSYISCFIRSSGTYPADKDDTATYNDIDIYCPSPWWITEQTVIIDPVESASLLSTDKTYDTYYSYPYTYMSTGSSSKQIYIDHYAPCDFQMKLYGPVNSVNVTIGNVELVVSRAIPSGGYMIIDTREHIDVDKHCYIVSGSTETNCFNYRNPSSSLLEKVEPGFVTVTYSRDTELDLTIFKERSEPAWEV